MYFESLQAALDMQGHGAYVWSCYALTFAVIAVLLIVPIKKARRIRAGIRGELRRRAAAEKSAGNASSDNQTEENHASQA